MNEKIREFISKNPPKYKLKKFNDDIVTLLKEGCTQAEILLFLQEYHQVKVSRSTLARQISYIKSNSKTVRTVENPTVRTVQKSESGKQDARARYALPKTMNGDEMVETLRKQIQAREEAE